MAELVRGATAGEAWHRSLALLATNDRQIFDLLVEVVDPTMVELDRLYIAALDHVLLSRGWQDTQSVANTIFPAGLARTSRTRDRLYARYLAMHRGLRRASKKNSKGLYFERLIRYPLQPDEARANQLETIIRALEGARSPGGLYHAYELQIFCPGKDLRPRGFPCLSSISAHVDGDRLRLSATYRNQYYIQKALGNFIGLAALQQFIADHAGLELGTLSIHAFHAQIDPEASAGQVATLMASLPNLREEQ
ncbi:MAG: hypothetical protein H0U52_06180 [Chloroflexi bacterium]|nr:hypothetical protein [Chloroflexota bacterium]